jgi:Pyridoxamine 5'-phosphate oxidase
MHETPETVAELQAIIDRSARTAGPAIAMNFIGGGWQMSAEEFIAFWGEERMATISTASGKGAVHAAPLEVRLIDGKFHATGFADSQRLRDHRANPRCAITSWDGPYRAVIVYGVAEIDAASNVIIAPTRIYGIRPPEGHHAYEPPEG